MVIEGADKFGLAQLHQLRGRVGRDGRQAYCFLIADPTTTAARRRLHAVRASTDGFALARADLELRGPGELLGMKQSGLPDLSPLAQAAHPELLDAVDASARALLSAAANAGRRLDASLFRLVEQRFGTRGAGRGPGGVTMRVIGGSRRGIRLASLAGRSTRPTSDRVKESLFKSSRPTFPAPVSSTCSPAVARWASRR